ncbi:MAG: cell division protein FtsZ [Bacteroidales bacterium]|nr:cell division protein FtsZ [Bacteroidales bacterium]
MIKFDAPKEMSSIIKVIGVGGGGSNAVNHMFKQGIRGVDFIICNTDEQALDISPIPNKVQLGASLTDGRGAGSVPEVGKNAAIENIEEIREMLDGGTKMLFITAGMGGGTGTGAAPVIAAVAKEMGILTVGIVTIPFGFEGRKRRMQADSGLEELRANVDTLLIVSNDKLRDLYGNLRLGEAFSKADDILTDAAKGIAELITVTGYINVDFEDVKTVMRDSGVAIMGTGRASGEQRALEAVEMALASPLLNDNNIKGASDILLYMASGTEELSMDEVAEITDYIQEEAGLTAEMIWGNGNDETLEDSISITVIATGFATNSDVEFSAKKNKVAEKVVHKLEDTKVEEAPKQAAPTVVDEYDDMRIITRPSENKDTKEPQEPTANVQPEAQIGATTTYPSSQPESAKNVVVHSLDDDVESYQIPENQHSINKEASQANIDTAFKQKADERINRLRGLSHSFGRSEDLKEVENTPAYVRRGVALSDTPAADENNVSRYSLDSETGEMKSNNSFLHDNVD